MLHEYVDLFRLRLPINPREQTFVQMPPPPPDPPRSTPPSSPRHAGLTRMTGGEEAQEEHLAVFMGVMFSFKSCRLVKSNRKSRWKGRIDSNEIGCANTPFSSASFECSNALDLSPARFQTLDYITKARRIERTAFTFSLFTRHRTAQSSKRTDRLPYQSGSKADLSPNLCPNRAST